jgi:hypothetical protein
MSKLNGRLEKLEAKLKAFAKQTIWVDLFDNRVRIDIGGLRGEEITFDSVFDCIAWVENQIAQFEKITGLAYISDVSELFAEGLPREMFNRIHEGAPSKSVLIGLHTLHGRSIAEIAFISWRRNLTGIAFQDWWKEVLARVDALSQSPEEEGEEAMP